MPNQPSSNHAGNSHTIKKLGNGSLLLLGSCLTSSLLASSSSNHNQEAQISKEAGHAGHFLVEANQNRWIESTVSDIVQQFLSPSDWFIKNASAFTANQAMNPNETMDAGASDTPNPNETGPSPGPTESGPSPGPTESDSDTLSASASASESFSMSESASFSDDIVISTSIEFSESDSLSDRPDMDGSSDNDGSNDSDSGASMSMSMSMSMSESSSSDSSSSDSSSSSNSSSSSSSSSYDSYYDCYVYTEGQFNWLTFPERIGNNAIPALPPDVRYRDMCVTGATLPPTSFDEETGLLTARDVEVYDYVEDAPSSSSESSSESSESYEYSCYDYYNYWPDSISQFDEAYVGRVTGSKPTGGACMPLRDTPKVNTGLYRFDPALAFQYLLNIDDKPFLEGAESPDAYRRSNASLSKTFFIEGVLGCPDIIDYKRNYQDKPWFVRGIPEGEPIAFWRPKASAFGFGGYERIHDRETIHIRAELMQRTADFCYNYYMLGRSLLPWFNLERPGFSTDDPLSFFDPDRTYLNSCQPFTRGASIYRITDRDLPSPDPLPSPAPPYVCGLPLNPPPRKATACDPTPEQPPFIPPDQLPKPQTREACWDVWRGDLHDQANSRRDDPMYIPGAREIQWAAWNKKPYTSFMEKQSGLAPVYSFPGRADMDQAEYLLSEVLSESWNANFKPDGMLAGTPFTIVEKYKNPQGTLQEIDKVFPNPFKDVQIPLPCIQAGGTLPPATSHPIEPADLRRPRQFNTCEPDEPSPDTPAECVVRFFTIRSDETHISRNTGPHYCPNVEKILEPSHPFSPRHSIVTEGFKTDRDYSELTSTQVARRIPSRNECPDRIAGYTDYRVDQITQRGSLQTPKRHSDMNRYRAAMPTVQCGIVPVDILSFRERAFRSCIMQRINWNFNVFMYYLAILDDSAPVGTSYDRFGRRIPGTFNPPCKTRYWETDAVTPTAEDGAEDNMNNFAGCPVRMSIQQCCNIITKDVVPANILKIRTCEGLIQKRRENEKLQKAHYLNGKRRVFRDGAWVDLDDPRTHLTMASPIQPVEFYDPLLGMKSRHIAVIGAGETIAKHITTKLNEITCDGTEPTQYRFENWFPQHINQEMPNPSPQPDECKDDNWLPDRSCLHGKKIGSHLPYMRWWDTGASAGNAYIGGSPVNTLGTYDVIVGVGREGREKVAAKQTEELYEKLGSSSEVKNRVKQEQTSQVSRIGGWSELKAHQMWTIRRNNLSCIGRYEKMFKLGSAENFVLSKAGSGYTSRVGEQWPWPLGWRGYVTATDEQDKFPNFGSTGSVREIKGLDNALPGDIIVYQPRRYPANTVIRSTSPAQPYGMPQIYFVTDIGGFRKESGELIQDSQESYFDYQSAKFRLSSSNAGGEEIYPTKVFVRSWDQGKFPSATGMSIYWGMGIERTIYRSAVPENYRNDICDKTMRALTDFVVYDSNDRKKMPSYCRDNMNKEELDKEKCVTENCQPSCLDSSYSACVLPNGSLDWDAVTIYRPDTDVRQCPNPGITMPTISDVTLDLSKTYQWKAQWETGPSGEIKLEPPKPEVIYQSRTEKVPTNLWSWCVNAGYDPPSHFSLEYKGAMTGAITDTTICAPLPHMKDATGLVIPNTGCSTRPGEQHFFFPKSLIR
ncbi:MAG: hypothetical protein SFW63_06175 [Alphaproteobacteria bacterium]|nr:hypothetical protein [Alphaproteobacteria bacterium]